MKLLFANNNYFALTSDLNSSSHPQSIFRLIFLVTGLGVASMIIPQSLACAILATVDPIYGLYTALVSFKIATLSSH